MLCLQHVYALALLGYVTPKKVGNQCSVRVPAGPTKPDVPSYLLAHLSTVRVQPPQEATVAVRHKLLPLIYILDNTSCYVLTPK